MVVREYINLRALRLGRRKTVSPHLLLASTHYIHEKSPEPTVCKVGGR